MSKKHEVSRKIEWNVGALPVDEVTTTYHVVDPVALKAWAENLVFEAIAWCLERDGVFSEERDGRLYACFELPESREGDPRVERPLADYLGELAEVLDRSDSSDLAAVRDRLRECLAAAERAPGKRA